MTIPPFTADQWHPINALGQQIDQALEQAGVGLTLGGEPTYVAAQDRESWEWRYGALGADKRRLGGQLLTHLQQRLASPGCLLHYGLGKLYPGELVPRWALGCFWRQDGEPLWRNPELLATDDTQANHTQQDAATFMAELVNCLAVPVTAIMAAHAPEDEKRVPLGWVLPLLTTTYEGQVCWRSCRWTGCESGITVLPGEAALGLRLPLQDLPTPEHFLTEVMLAFDTPPIRPQIPAPLAPDNSIRLALVVEVRRGIIHVFLPPMTSARSYADVLTAIEATAEVLDQPVVIEGYTPPRNQGIQGFQITPDPGVLEVNIHPAENWPDLVYLHQSLDEAAIACGLSCERYSIDGRIQGTGGGAHITIGGHQPETSPLLRRPDLLRSFISYWQHHPSLSYLFAGQYIGPTSQSPRIDEGRHDSLYELELAFLAIAPGKPVPPEIVDRLLSPLLQDVSGNTHRTELCIDKLYPWHNPGLRLGLLEFRGFEMPPTTGQRLLQMLLIRACVAWFWQQPFTQPLRRWGPDLRDRWLLPHALIQDLQTVLADLTAAGYPFVLDWFTPFLENRFPRYGSLALGAHPTCRLELRAALEPWPVIGDAGGGGVSRPVDNSLERLQVFLTGALGDACEPGALADRYIVLCNGHRVPLRSTGTLGDYVGAVRFRARSPLALPHPALAPQAPLTFQVIDTQSSQWLGGVTFHVDAPTGQPYETLPDSPETARSRLKERFVPHPQGTVPKTIPPLIRHPETPMTLDLRLVSQKTN